MRGVFVILFFMVLSCDQQLPEDGPNAPGSGPVDFSNLSVGQTSTYIGFNAGNIYRPEDDFFEYTADTLVLEVIEQTAGAFTFLEYIKPGSASLALWQDSVSYRVSISDDTLTITPINTQYIASNLFLLNNAQINNGPLNNAKMPLANIETNEGQLDGIKLTTSEQGLLQSGFIRNHTQMGRQFEHLNFLYDATVTPVDGPSYTVIYNKEAGIVRVFTTNVWTGTATGWDFLE